MTGRKQVCVNSLNHPSWRQRDLVENFLQLFVSHFRFMSLCSSSFAMSNFSSVFRGFLWSLIIVTHVNHFWQSAIFGCIYLLIMFSLSINYSLCFVMFICFCKIKFLLLLLLLLLLSLRFSIFCTSLDIWLDSNLTSSFLLCRLPVNANYYNLSAPSSVQLSSVTESMFYAVL